MTAPYSYKNTIATAAALASGTRLSELYSMCENQKTVSTKKLLTIVKKMHDDSKLDAIHFRALADKLQSTQSQWNPPETAPKDGTMFLGKFCYSWPVCAAWNEPAEKFCIAQLQVGLYHGKWNDAYFEHDYVSAKELLAWRPLPQLPEDKPHEHAKFTKRS